MIEITIYRKNVWDDALCSDFTSYICGYRSEGHAEAEACAAVSALTQMPLVALESCGYKPEFELDSVTGLLDVKLSEEAMKNSGLQLLLNTMENCLVDIAWQYDDVTIKEVEENEQESKI